VRTGNPRRNRGLIACGAATAALVLTAGGIITYHAARGFDFNTIKPLWWLRAEIDSADSATGDAARREILGRLASGKLSDEDEKSPIDPILAVQANADLPWHYEWGDYFEGAWQRGLVSEEQLRSYLLTAIDTGLHLEARQRMRAGSRVAIAITVETRSARDSMFSLGYKVEELTFGGTPVDDDVLHRSEWSGHLLRPTGAGGRYFYFRVAPPVGTHELRARLQVMAGESDLLGVRSEQELSHEAKVEKVVELTSQVEVVPPDVPVMNFVDTPEIREALRGSIVIQHPRLKADGEGKAAILGSLASRQSPIEFNADVFWRVDGLEQMVGFIHTREDGPYLSADSSWGGWNKIPLTGVPKRIDIILRASLERAETAARIMNDTPVWVGELVWEDVEVEFLGVDELPYQTIETDEALEAFRQSIALEAIELKVAGDEVSITGRGGFFNVPYNFGYSVAVRAGDRDLPGSSTTIRAGDSRDQFIGYCELTDIPADLQMADVVFSPSLGMAANEFGGSDLVFNREIVIENVPVIWIRE
jgi:hypothetical protein